ncbi:expansin-like protein [Trichoderma chlorosporum]
MVCFITTAIFTLSLAIVTSAAPIEAEIRAASTYSGSLTWYNPGLGACGWTNNDNNPVVAVSRYIYDSESVCDRKIRVTYKGQSEVLTVVDRCEGCAVNDLDLSPAAFRGVVGDLKVGRTDGTWEWA